MLCANFQRNLTAHLKDSFPSGKSRVVEKDILYTELAYGSLPELAQYCGLNSRDHLALEAKQTTRRRQGGGELVVEEEMKMHELLNYGVERYQHTKMLGYSTVWGKTDIRHSG